MDTDINTMTMDELAKHLMSLTKGTRFKISKLTLEVRDKIPEENLNNGLGRCQ